MARVSYVRPQDAPPETARALERLPDAHVFGLLAQARTAFVPWLRLGGSLLNDLSLPASLRELVILQVGRLAQRYEWDQHVPIAQSAGITDEQIAALEAGDDSGPFDPTQRAVLSFVADLVRDGEVHRPGPTLWSRNAAGRLTGWRCGAMMLTGRAERQRAAARSGAGVGSGAGAGVTSAITMATRPAAPAATNAVA